MKNKQVNKTVPLCEYNMLVFKSLSLGSYPPAAWKWSPSFVVTALANQTNNLTPQYRLESLHLYIVKEDEQGGPNAISFLIAKLKI